MSKIIYLKFDTDKGIVTIPFKNIKSVDQFTIIYDDIDQLVGSIIDVLKLPLSVYDVNSVYLTYDKYNMGLNVETCMPIKYSGDNFNFESLKDAFAKYIQNDQSRILSTDMKYVKGYELSRYFERGYLDNYEISRAVNAFFSENAGYKRRRDMYFFIKESDEGIPVKIDSVDFEIDIKGGLKSFSTYGGGEEDDYLSYLLEFAQRGEKELEIAMDAISQFDLEDLERLRKNNSFGIVDGVRDDSILMERQKTLLAVTTGMSIEKLRLSCNSFGRKSRRR